MEWLRQLNEAINYMEENLTGQINYQQVAQIACCSTFHFQRMFSYIADVSLAQYVRRRKMTLAALDLQNGEQKIIDIALKYGYDSPTSFNRAFQSIHGVSPSVAKVKGTSLKAYPPISFKISIKGAIEMNYRIEKEEGFRMVGVKERYQWKKEECFQKIPLFWQKMMEEQILGKLCPLMTQKLEAILGVSVALNEQEFDYYIAVATDEKTPTGMIEYMIPACDWAIFECIGAMPKAIQEMQKRIVTEWLPNSGYEYANAPDIEVYFHGDQNSLAYQCEIWFPIKKKN